MPVPVDHTTHNALCDARYQAVQVAAAYRVLGLSRSVDTIPPDPPLQDEES